MKEVRAADPNVTFLDDGNITYKDLEHGVFELVTKEAIPRHILVEDPGQTIVLRPQGSSVSVNEVTNSPARMAELQAAQQDALATSQKGVGSTGSSTSRHRSAAGTADQLPERQLHPDAGCPSTTLAASCLGRRTSSDDTAFATAAADMNAIAAERNRHRGV
jgi:hypothetical protein